MSLSHAMRRSIAGFAAMAALAVLSASPVQAQTKPCKLSKKFSEHLSGELSVAKGAAGLMVKGQFLYRTPEDKLELHSARFADGVPVKLGMAFDFSMPAADAAQGVRALERDAFEPIRIFVGRIDSTRQPSLVWVGGNLLVNYNVEAHVRGWDSGPVTYVGSKHNSYGGTNFEFAKGDKAISNRILRGVLKSGGGNLDQSLSVEITTPGPGARPLSASFRIADLRPAAETLLAGSGGLVAMAQNGNCAVL